MIYIYICLTTAANDYGGWVLLRRCACTLRSWHTAHRTSCRSRLGACEEGWRIALCHFTRRKQQTQTSQPPSFHHVPWCFIIASMPSRAKVSYWVCRCCMRLLAAHRDGSGRGLWAGTFQVSLGGRPFRGSGEQGWATFCDGNCDGLVSRNTNYANFI